MAIYRGDRMPTPEEAAEETLSQIGDTWFGGHPDVRVVERREYLTHLRGALTKRIEQLGPDEDDE